MAPVIRSNISCELISWSEFHELVRKLAFKIRENGFEPDAIVAIGRGGYMPARVLADYLNVMNLVGFRIEHYWGPKRTAEAVVKDPLSVDLADQRVLIVDDVSDTGQTFQRAVEHIRERTRPAGMRTATLHHKVASSFVPDYFAMKVRKWRWLTYPWALMEDLTTFIKAMEPRPGTLEGIARQLDSRHGLQVPRQILEDALAIVGN